MGQYLICGAVAKKPFYVRQLGIRLYTAEELCYYIYNNISLIEDDFVNESLLSFLREGLGLSDLADKIEKLYGSTLDMDNILLMILKDVPYYNESEIARFQDRLYRLRRQNRLERRKDRADQLFEMERYEGAIREYSEIISSNRDMRLKPYFYAQVLQHMGAAYMQLGLTDEALECLQAAYKEAAEPFLLKQMFFLAMAAERPYPRELESVDAVSLTQWQQDYLEVQNRHLAGVGSDGSQLIYYENGEQRKEAIQKYLDGEKKQYRMMIMEGG